MDRSLRIGAVHIVEWLRGDDAKTGRELFDEVEPLGIVCKPPMPVKFYSVATRSDLVTVLRAIADDFLITGKYPLLHIETHGSIDGIGVSHEEGFSFAELMKELIPLNELTGLRLVLFLAACEGIWGITMLQPSDRAAYLALFGPNRTVTARELTTACQIFYRGILSADKSGDRTMKAMNAAINPAKETFFALNAEMAFRMVYRLYLERIPRPEALVQRVEKLLMQAHQDSFMRRGRVLVGPEIESTRALFMQHISAHEEHFNRFRRDYFLIDRFPENDGRFPITFSDCAT